MGRKVCAVTQRLPSRPSLTQLRHQAKDLLRAHAAKDRTVCPLLRGVPRLAGAEESTILRSPLSLCEVQEALARDYGFAGWSALKRHVEEAAGAAPAKPTYARCMEYYLRPDVLNALWEVSRRRALRFHYYCPGDIRAPHAPTLHTTLHCLADPAELARRITQASDKARGERPGFYPFFGMSPKVNRPDHPEQIVGWDMRFELDFGIEKSFLYLLPLAGVLQHVGIQYLLKFSGHRSLHLILPAEPFRACLPGEVNQAQWNEQAAMLGRLLCRFVPPWTDGDIGKANDMILTAPYSLHRFNGLVSVPLTLEQATAFDSSSAAVEAVEGATLDGGVFEQDVEAAAKLVELARRCQADPAASLALAREAFATERWKALAVTMHASEASGVARLLMAGHVGAPFVKCPDPASDGRAAAAFAAMDDPANKKLRLLRSIEHFYGPSEAVMLEFRRLQATALAAWVEGGFGRLLEYACKLAGEHKYITPILLATRLTLMAPEADHVRSGLLGQVYGRLDADSLPAARAMLAVAIASWAQGRAERLAPLAKAKHAAEAQACLSILAKAGSWNVEDRPDLVLIVLALAFGREMAQRWIRGQADARGGIIMPGLFGDCRNDAKFHKMVAKAYGPLGGEASHATN